jgi:hypothetical protein
MVKIKIADSAQLKNLLDAKGYEDLVGKSAH